ncbi:Uric acid degradation bifunctional protein PucL [compost metagenome]
MRNIIALLIKLWKAGGSMSAETDILTLEQINGMNRTQFVEALGGIFEHSPWVAEEAYAFLPVRSAEELHRVMLQTARSAPRSQVDELLRAHPDLATRLQVTPLSAAEQQGAGLDRLTAEEFERLTGLNAAYTEKFGFPFILAVRGKNKDDIIEAISERVHHPLEQEREQALEEIGRITGFRLHDLLAEAGGTAG